MHFSYTDQIEMTNLYIEMRNPKKSQADITPWNFNGFPTNSVNQSISAIESIIILLAYM